MLTEAPNKSKSSARADVHCNIRTALTHTETNAFFSKLTASINHNALHLNKHIFLHFSIEKKRNQLQHERNISDPWWSVYFLHIHNTSIYICGCGGYVWACCINFHLYSQRTFSYIQFQTALQMIPFVGKTFYSAKFIFNLVLMLKQCYGVQKYTKSVCVVCSIIIVHECVWWCYVAFCSVAAKQTGSQLKRDFTVILIEYTYSCGTSMPCHRVCCAVQSVSMCMCCVLCVCFQEGWWSSPRRGHKLW